MSALKSLIEQANEYREMGRDFPTHGVGELPDQLELVAKEQAELVEALEQIISMVESTYCTPDAMDDPIWQVANGALSKARGEVRA